MRAGSRSHDRHVTELAETVRQVPPQETVWFTEMLAFGPSKVDTSHHENEIL